MEACTLTGSCMSLQCLRYSDTQGCLQRQQAVWPDLTTPPGLPSNPDTPGQCSGPVPPELDYQRVKHTWNAEVRLSPK